jgi:phage tail sheath protein FI
MTRPGVVITSRADQPPRSAPTDAGVAFMAGKTEKGPPYGLASSMTQYETIFGKREGFTDAFDAAESYFREGGAKLTVAPAADAAGLTTALGVLTKDLGPGQIFVPGSLGTSATAQGKVLDHAAEANRIALLAAPTDVAADLQTLADTFATNVNARYGALFAPQAVVPGLTSGTTRTVDYPALAAGIIARNDALYGVNDPAAGVHGISRFAIDLTATYTDDERESLNDAGVDIARSIYGQVQTYGYRTLAELDTGWGLLSNARLNMAIVAKCEAVAERYVFSQLDGRRVRINQFGADLTGVLVPYYESGQLFGETAQDAFYVDVGQAVNPDEQLAQGILRAVIGLRMSPFAELVVIEIVKVATDQPLALAA